PRPLSFIGPVTCEICKPNGVVTSPVHSAKLGPPGVTVTCSGLRPRWRHGRKHREDSLYEEFSVQDTFNQLVISPFPGHPVVREDPERAPQRLVTSSHLPTRTLNHRDA
ncbi:hypothetical protein H109_02578, partial [Trichophyton interdigitale MR816]